MTAPVRRILIVDDSPEDREVYRRFFRADTAHHYEFLEAEAGTDGLALSVGDHPDCVLLDYRMPDLDGLSFLQSLPRDEDGLNVPVIVLTGQGSESVAVEAMKNGAQDYLVKSSITAAGLLRAVAHAIDRVQLRRSIRTRTRELSEANAELQREVGQRKRAEEALQRTYDDLERLVEARTAELQKANLELSVEVAERRRVEEERAQLLVREQQANRLKDEFLATVSHELRTPLNAVLGWTRVLRSATVSPTLQERALESIERNAMAQARLIEDILEVSRIVTGKLRLRVRPLDLAHVIDAALDVVRPAADAKSIRLERHIPPGPWPGIGDPDRLQQVVWNLLSNAVKFTPRHGCVSISLEQREGQDQIVVADTGRGIDPAFLPHVFAPFRQADASTTREQGGLGLGLAIARQLVELHGGMVHAESGGLGRGARFIVALPAHAADETVASVLAQASAAPAPQPAPAAAPELAGVRVLMVDDDPDARELVTTTLRFYGADVTAVESAAHALAVLGQVRPDVLLSDIGMSGEDGYSFIRRVRALPADQGGLVPAVAVTAYAAAGDRARSLAAGFQLHISKPFDPQELGRIVQRLVVNAPADGGSRRR
jgi:signal transduction histidine kinase